MNTGEVKHVAVLVTAVETFEYQYCEVVIRVPCDTTKEELLALDLPWRDSTQGCNSQPSCVTRQLVLHDVRDVSSEEERLHAIATRDEDGVLRLE